MKKLAAIFTLGFISTVGLRAQLANPDLDQKFYDGQSNVVAALGKYSTSTTRLFLYSLLPDHGQEWLPLPEFHGYPILGSTEIISFNDKKELLEVFILGVKECDNYGGRCFIPHHGLRVIDELTTNDFVICYECCHVYAYDFNEGVISLGNGIEEFETSDSPKSVFEKFINQYYLNYRWLILPGVIAAMLVLILISVLKLFLWKKVKLSMATE